MFRGRLFAGYQGRVDNADLHSAIGRSRFGIAIANKQLGFAKTLCTDKALIDSRLNQRSPNSSGATGGEFQVVLLCPAVIRISVYVNGISLERRKDTCNAVQNGSILRCNVRFVGVEPKRLLSQRHHQSMWSAARFRDLPEGLFQLLKLAGVLRAIFFCFVRGLSGRLRGCLRLKGRLRLRRRCRFRLFHLIGHLLGANRSCLGSGGLGSSLIETLDVLLGALHALVGKLLCLTIEVRHFSGSIA